jgi:Trypsin-co-occurring domain 1
MSMRVTKMLAPDGSEIYIQYDETETEELAAVGAFEDLAARAKYFQEALARTIHGYTSLVLDAVRPNANEKLKVSKVTLEFGIQLGGESGVPFIAKGTAQGNVKVTIDWTP